MQAHELLSSYILKIHPNEDVKKALSLMDELQVKHLPVIQGKSYLGILSEEQVLEWKEVDELISNHLANLIAPYVIESQHLFDVIDTLEKNRLTIVPVLNKKKEYLGSISNKELL